MRIEQRYCIASLQREYDVARIQHVQNRSQRGIHLLHVASHCRQFIIKRGYFALNMFFYNFLITAEFCRMVTANAFMPIRRIVLVKCIDRQIQHTVIQRLVFQNLFIGGRRLHEGLHFRTFRHELLIIKVTLVHIPHIRQTEQRECGYQNGGFHTLRTIDYHQHESYQHDEETTPSIGCENSLTHVFQIYQNRCQLVGRNSLFQCTHFHCRNVRREKERWSQCKQQSESSGQHEADIERP